MVIDKNPQYVATFDVDPQNGFTPLCPGELPVAGGDEIIRELNEQAKYARYRLGSKDAHSLSAVYNATEVEPQFTPVNGYPDVDIKWNPHCIIGTYGAKLLSGLPKETEYDFFVWKGIEPTMHPYGACYHDSAEKLSTGAIEYLVSKEVRTVIVGGLATDYCVKQTVLQLLRVKGLTVVVNLGACRGIATATVEAAKEAMVKGGAVLIQKASDFESLNVWPL